MTESSTGRSALGAVIGGLMLIEGVVFVLAALLHAGVQLPLGIDGPRILPATIVEGVIGVVFLIAAWGVFRRRASAWKGALMAHAVAAGGILLGMVALGLGQGPRTSANDVYHRVMFVLAALMIILLRTRAGRSAFNADRN